MPRRNATFSLVVLATLGLATGCERHSPWVTVTAGGVVVKARAANYCFDDGKCVTSNENPRIEVQAGDILGIDVPRSLAKQGWRIGDQGGYSNDLYRAIPIGGNLQPGNDVPLQIVRNSEHGAGEWVFTVVVT